MEFAKLNGIVGKMHLPYELRCVSFDLAGKTDGHRGFTLWKDVDRSDDEMHSFMRCATEFAEVCGMIRSKANVSNAGTSRIVCRGGLYPMAIFAQHEQAGDGEYTTKIFMVSRRHVIKPIASYVTYKCKASIYDEPIRSSNGDMLRSYFIVKKESKK